MNRFGFYPPPWLICLVGLTILAGCRPQVDNPQPDGQHGTVTTLTLILSDSSTFPIQRDTFVFDDPDGAGGNQPLRWDTLRWRPSRTYAAQLFLTNKLASPPQELNPLITAQGNQHLFVYQSDTSFVTIHITDRDLLNLPLGFQSSWQSRNRIGSGHVQIGLRHIAFGKNLNSGANSGHSDIQVSFPFVAQP
ncbi:MAG: hypothetical protein RLZZ121_648 [Bacteroidota bacterium]